MLRLRPYKNCDADAIAGWISNEVSFYQWSAGQYPEYPLTASAIRSHYASYENSENFFAMTAFDEDGAAGHLIMRFPSEDRSILRFGFIIVSSDRRGKGYGKEMLRLALRYAFEILKVQKVTLGVFENNPSAYHCYRSVGFSECIPPQSAKFSFLGETWNCLELEICAPA